MTYHFMHYFNVPSYTEHLKFKLTDEQKLELARRRAINDLVDMFMKNSEFYVDADGNVRGTLVIPETNA